MYRGDGCIAHRVATPSTEPWQSDIAYSWLKVSISIAVSERSLTRELDEKGARLRMCSLSEV